MELEILDLIPQRKPFLFVDKIIEKSEKKIKTELKLTGDEDYFKGHFPKDPIMPGVLLQEAIFQSGAALMSTLGAKGTGVITRVQNAKFKSIVRPGDLLEMEVVLIESLLNAHYMKGTIKVLGKIVMQIDFTVASLES